MPKSAFKSGIKAYDALQTIRRFKKPSEVPPEAVTTFEDHGANMGYALLLMRYTDDPRTGHPPGDPEGCGRHHSSGRLSSGVSA